jgi:hypothetical protein
MNWNEMSPVNMAALAHSVSAKIAAGTTTFPSPTITPAALDAAANRLELAYANRMNGAAAKTEFNVADAAVDDLLHTEAAYVNDVAKGNTAIIEASGFTATTNGRKKAVVPATPDAPKIWGNAAALHLQIPAVPGATSYCWIIFTGDATNATIADTHIGLNGPAIVIPEGITRELLHNVIAAGTKITVQVLAQNTAGKSGFSAAVSFTVGS